MDHSMLFGPLAAESALARRLAKVLPPPLRERLATPGGPVNLGIAPAPVLAGVPWSVVGTGAEAGDTRLVERCRLAVAPPAGLLAALARRPRRDGTFPLSLAVLNPASALGDPRHDLLSASALAHVAPSPARAPSPRPTP